MLLVLLALFLAEPAAQEAGEGAARGVKDEPEQKHIRFVFPQPWLVVRELGDGLRIRVDASDFLSVWLGSGCSLSLLANGQATETERINASFHIEEGLSFGPHKLGAMVTTYDGDVLAIATVIFLYAPGELGQHVPVPTPVTLPRRVPHGAQEGSRGACKPNRRMVRALLQNSGIDCANRAQLVRGHGTDGVVIDVGSHDGHELNALSAVARKVIAFEATPHKAAAIEKLLKEQGIWHKVVLHAAAACNTSGELPLHVPHGEGGSEMDSLGSTFYYTGQQKTINVKSVRIDV
jgi:FkbM family methyltransferase